MLRKILNVAFVSIVVLLARSICSATIYYVDAGLDNTTINGAAPVEGINYTTSTGPGYTDRLWHYRDKDYLASNDFLWESAANESEVPLIVSVVLPIPGTYIIYGLSEIRTTINYDCAYSLDGGITYGIANRLTAACSDIYYVRDNYDIVTIDGGEIGKYWGIYAVGTVETTIPNEVIEVYVQGPEGQLGGDERTSFDGIGYQWIADTSGIGGQHLVMTDQRMYELKNLIATENRLYDFLRAALDEAEAYLTADALTYQIVDDRLLAVSREAVKRMYTLCLAWRWTEQPQYALAARDNLVTICQFSDWHWSHFLDTAEMTHAAAIGYNWLSDYLGSSDKELIRQAIIDKGLEPGLGVYDDTLVTSHDWPNWNNNWNQVCNYSMIIGALAIAETDPYYFEEIIPRATNSLSLAMQEYALDGAWPEGPGYWGYGTSYTVYGISALESMLGTDLGMSEYLGFSETADYALAVEGPTKRPFNFSDCNGHAPVYLFPFSLWLGEKFDSPYAIANEYAKQSSDYSLAEDTIGNPSYVIYYQPSVELLPQDYPASDLFFNGRVPVASFRSDWNDDSALMFAIKGGDNQFSHAHLDLGSFVLDTLGIRFVSDLGADSYALPGYFHEERWDYYRCSSFSHNIMTINGDNQDLDATASMYDFVTSQNLAGVKVDLTEAYSDFVTQAIREVEFTGRDTVTVQDTIQATTACDITWGITTETNAELLSSTMAKLSTGEGFMIVELNEPAGAVFVVNTPQSPLYYHSLDDVTRLETINSVSAGTTNISVSFKPGLSIMEQPQTSCFSNGQAAQLQIRAGSFSTVTYQWYKSSDALISPDDTPVGTNSATYQAVIRDSVKGYYYCKLNNDWQMPIYSRVVEIISGQLLARYQFDSDLSDTQQNTSDGQWYNSGGYTTGVEGMCANMTSQTQYISIADGYPKIGVSSALSMGTVCAWVKPTVITSSDTVYSNWNDGGNTAFSLSIVDASDVKFYFRDDNGKAITLQESCGYLLTDGYWHHVAVAYAIDGVCEIYLDGCLLGSRQADFDINDFSPWQYPMLIGAGRNTTDRTQAGTYLQAYVDELRIYNYPLTQKEMIDIYRYQYPESTFCIDDYGKQFDFNDDCVINLEDFANLANSWLSSAVDHPYLLAFVSEWLSSGKY